MSKYTAEEVEFRAAALRCGNNDMTCDMLMDYAALLREREAAKSLVTDAVVDKAVAAFNAGPSAMKAFTASGVYSVRKAIEAVAPMLVSARIQELSHLLSEAQEHHLACIKDAYRLLGIDGSDGEYRYKWVALELTKLASARVPAGWRIGDVDVAQDGDMWTAGIDVPVNRRYSGNGIHANAIECHAATKQLAKALRAQVMLAAAPKPETEE